MTISVIRWQILSNAIMPLYRNWGWCQFTGSEISTVWDTVQLLFLVHQQRFSKHYKDSLSPITYPIDDNENMCQQWYRLAWIPKSALNFCSDKSYLLLGKTPFLLNHSYNTYTSSALHYNSNVFYSSFPKGVILLNIEVVYHTILYLKVHLFIHIFLHPTYRDGTS